MAKPKMRLTVLDHSVGWGRPQLDVLGQLGRLLHHPDHPCCAVLVPAVHAGRIEDEFTKAEVDPGEYEHQIVKRGDDPAIPVELHPLLLFT
jgi:hypothetical protein